MTRVTPGLALVGATRKSIPWDSRLIDSTGGEKQGDEFSFVLAAIPADYQVRVAGRLPGWKTTDNTVVVEVGERYGSIAGTTLAAVDVSIEPGEHHYRVRSKAIRQSGDDPNVIGFLLAAASGVAIGLDRLALTATA